MGSDEGGPAAGAQTGHAPDLSFIVNELQELLQKQVPVATYLPFFSFSRNSESWVSLSDATPQGLIQSFHYFVAQMTLEDWARHTRHQQRQ